MDTNYERSVEETTKVLELAKLQPESMLPTTQAIYFTSANFYDHNYKLLQLEPDLIDEIKAGNTLYFKGDDDENVVLCSQTKTYQISNSETSNSLLLLPSLQFSHDLKNEDTRSVKRVEVAAIFHNYLEPSLSNPQFRKLHNLLKNSLYKGRAHESEIDPSLLYSFEELDAIIQASTKELQMELDTLTIVKFANSDKIRLLDFEYHFRILSYMLQLIEENSWPLDEIDYEETKSALVDLAPFEVIEALFDKYCSESKVIDGLQLYCYKEVEVCRFFAQVLLYNSKSGMRVDDFRQTWQESVPEGMQTDDEMLFGVAILSEAGDLIKSFDGEGLPEEINERLAALFAIKAKWRVAEIAPYIRRLATDKLDVNALLAKHARASMCDGVKYYSAKHLI